MQVLLQQHSASSHPSVLCPKQQQQRQCHCSNLFSQKDILRSPRCYLHSSRQTGSHPPASQSVSRFLGATTGAVSSSVAIVCPYGWTMNVSHRRLQLQAREQRKLPLLPSVHQHKRQQPGRESLQLNAIAVVFAVVVAVVVVFSFLLAFLACVLLAPRHLLAPTTALQTPRPKRDFGCGGLSCPPVPCASPFAPGTVPLAVSATAS